MGADGTRGGGGGGIGENKTPYLLMAFVNVHFLIFNQLILFIMKIFLLHVSRLNGA